MRPTANAWRGSGSIKPTTFAERAYRALVSAALVRTKEQVPWA